MAFAGDVGIGKGRGTTARSSTGEPPSLCDAGARPPFHDHASSWTLRRPVAFPVSLAAVGPESLPGAHAQTPDADNVPIGIAASPGRSVRAPHLEEPRPTRRPSEDGNATRVAIRSASYVPSIGAMRPLGDGVFTLFCVRTRVTELRGFSPHAGPSTTPDLLIDPNVRRRGKSVICTDQKRGTVLPDPMGRVPRRSTG